MEQSIRSTQWTKFGHLTVPISLWLGCVVLANAALWTMPLNRVERWLLVIGVFLIFVVAYLAGRLSSPNLRSTGDFEQARLAELRAEDKYTALRTRLQPHFLFNTLHTISALIQIDRDRAESLILALSDVLRSTIGEQKDEVSLRTELELLRKYLEIEWTRFVDRLELDISVEPAALSGWISPFLLQPLVEYAVRTGVERRTEPSLIQLFLEVEGDVLRIEVKHDYTEGTVRHARKSTVSLEEIENRLRVIYGSEATMRVDQDPGGRHSVVIELPWITHE